MTSSKLLGSISFVLQIIVKQRELDKLQQKGKDRNIIMWLNVDIEVLAGKSCALKKEHIALN